MTDKDLKAENESLRKQLADMTSKMLYFENLATVRQIQIALLTPIVEKENK